jgi:DNA-binding NtrC family response regulator
VVIATCADVALCINRTYKTYNSRSMESYRILVIEDDPAIGQSLLDGFKQHGFQAELCKTGSSGVEYAQKHSPHLIVLDIRLPDSSGFDICQMRNPVAPKLLSDRQPMN